MRTSRVTRRVVRRWGIRIRQAGYGDLLLFLRLNMPGRDRETLGALLTREVQRRVRKSEREARHENHADREAG